jgi:dTDP-4-amino-4,6-dideoxygalactose transaminase
VDIDPVTMNLDPEGLERALSPRTRAVMPVHLFGQSAEMSPILDRCADRGIPVVEDAAQAIGTTWRGRPVGGVGDIGCFSFYPSKNLGGAGDGGLITSRRDDLADRVRVLRVHGSRQKYLHERVGFNSRLDSLQAAILSVKLDHLDRWSDARGEHARAYTEAFRDLGAIETPIDAGRGRHVWNQYVVRVKRGSRDALRDFLTERGVGSEIYYPVPLHLQPCFSDLGYQPGDLPRSEAAAKETLAIPVYPEMTSEQQGHVIESVRLWARGV